MENQCTWPEMRGQNHEEKNDILRSINLEEVTRTEHITRNYINTILIKSQMLKMQSLNTYCAET